MRKIGEERRKKWTHANLFVIQQMELKCDNRRSTRSHIHLGNANDDDDNRDNNSSTSNSNQYAGNAKML